MNEIRTAVLRWLNGLGIRNPQELSLEDYEQVKRLLGHDRPGFGIFLSMLMFMRQEAAAALVDIELSDSKGAVKAAKLQGRIQCVDMVRELIMNIADPIGESSSSGPREVAGVNFDAGTSEHDPVSTL